MKQITFYFDVISPYAYLAFEQLPKALSGLSYSIQYRPVLFAAMLNHHGQLGPAEIAPKRDWTYRQVLWLANTLGIALTMPRAHPFNPLPLLRLAVACSPEAGAGRFAGAPSRYVCETIFRHVWQASGAGQQPLDAADVVRLQALSAQLVPPRDVQSEAVKALLKTNTDDALAQGVFGVPAMVVDGLVFWGLDALPMLRDYLAGGSWFAVDSAAQGQANGVPANWQNVVHVATGVVRKPASAHRPDAP